MNYIPHNGRSSTGFTVLWISKGFITACIHYKLANVRKKSMSWMSAVCPATFRSNGMARLTTSFTIQYSPITYRNWVTLRG